MAPKKRAEMVMRRKLIFPLMDLDFMDLSFILNGLYLCVFLRPRLEVKDLDSVKVMLIFSSGSL